MSAVPTRRIALVPGLLLLASGCAAAGAFGSQAVGQAALAQASPLAPLRAVGGSYVPRSGGEAGMEEVSFGPAGFHATTTVSGDELAMLRQARLVPAEAAPCSAGRTVRQLRLDGERRWERPVSLTGTHRLRLDFSLPPAQLLRKPLAIDLTLARAGTTRCLRLPLHASGDDGGAPLFRRKSRQSAGGSVGLALNGAGLTADRTTNLLLGGSLGAWFARTRLGGRLEICAPGCDPRSFLSLPAILTVDQLLVVGRRLALAVDVGYQVGRLEDLVSLWSKPRTWVHGPRAGISLLGPAPFAAADRSQGFSTRGLRLFVQRQLPTVHPEVTTTDAAGVVTSRQVNAAWLFGLEAIAL